MAYKYREDLVGKRFLSVSGVTKINVNKVSEWGWKAGVIRAASLKDNKNKELQFTECTWSWSGFVDPALTSQSHRVRCTGLTTHGF
ncbi:hypothetical protein MSG28_009621 [Choristoneura fumiferana]|uniref:Uncharacterized protein n=1 Tax=Choristoneura fumiferana TaxID=7141 RepID=A0ACC0JBT8_CHOFU|nr:hypothetical protein MSG28_009621 [Choristoneura fumiferana]